VSRPRKTVARGYGEPHRKLREQSKRKVDQGVVLCVRCGRLISPDEPWDLGHHDFDRRVHSGPEHVSCNRSAGARPRHRRRPKARQKVAGGTAVAPRGRWDWLVERVPSGGVRCGLCGWLIGTDRGWRVGVHGPEHEVCENEPYDDGPPVSPRLWSRNW
jgi:hypothetical protein